eukprot:TRINITY_DN14842_c0_g1_i1.p1 TRINITY_DN14842_c0_g1~~TRINITY_DN14842_c0_g1_i1.p1  ORF type:complete len:116 (-),score=6.26 TRINITY_DN14842_c0_g1_i1:120-467(-)
MTQARPRPPNTLATVLEKHMNTSIHVKLVGGREVSGVLLSCDPQMNLVLDQTLEFERDPSDASKRWLVPHPDVPGALTEKTRYLGVVVCRGQSALVITPQDGLEEIANPWADAEA